jgi:hypothetical protein
VRLRSCLRESGGDRFDLGIGRDERCSVGQPRDYLGFPVVVLHLLRRERAPCIGFVRVAEPLGKHPDDLEPPQVEMHHASDRLTVALEAPLPQLVRDHE